MATSITAMSCQWLKDGIELSGATNTTYMISPLRTNGLGTYAVRVSNFAGATLSSNALLHSDSLEPTNCFPYLPGAVAWWPGNGTAENLTGISHGTYYNGATNVTGIVGQAFSFDGVNDYVAIADHPLLSPHVGPGGEMTIMAWVRITNYPSSGRPIVAKGTSGAWEYALYANANGSVQFYLWDLAGSVNYVSPSGGKLNLGQWHHLAGVLKKGQFARIYLDGVQVGQQTSFSGDTGDGSASFYLGARGGGPFFPGLVDEVLLFSRALGSNDIAAIYTAGSAGLCLPKVSPPAIVLQPANQTTIELRSVALIGLALGTPVPSYQWLFNGNSLSNGTNETLLLTNLNLAQAGGYALVASNVFGSTTQTGARSSTSPICGSA